MNPNENLMQKSIYTLFALENRELKSNEKLDLLDFMIAEYYAKWAYCSKVHPGEFSDIWFYQKIYRNLDYEKEYLNTWYWKYIQELAYEEYGKKCDKCGSESNIEIHHRNYKHLGNEYIFLEDLQILCRNCHEKVHKENQK